ncbi:hypothetical protein BpHYR1_044195 [Brachionus plicatilis]|uniref:Uncharacterized protein n=1 Tax=Brachionus plicatilis TaxID=10195 RepID=A0A3M7PAL8_BRAPC|nr:hypothetical protein BpHYR1_044195 [Brachionus plicatilis]
MQTKKSNNGLRTKQSAKLSRTSMKLYAITFFRILISLWIWSAYRFCYSTRSNRALGRDHTFS